MISLDFLDQVDMFQGLNDDQLSAIQKVAELGEFRKGEAIFTQGRRADHLWIVLDGEVELRCESEASLQKGVCAPVTFMSAAYAYGWTCFVPPYEYRLSGYCGSRQCRLIKLKKDDLEKLFEKYPEIGFAVMQYTINAVGTQFQELQDEMAKRRGEEIMSNW